MGQIANFNIQKKMKIMKYQNIALVLRMPITYSHRTDDILFYYFIPNHKIVKF